ncbi:hypothetical protein ACFLSJ_00960 [Verrucomicrobiota bacterium]
MAEGLISFPIRQFIHEELRRQGIDPNHWRRRGAALSASAVGGENWTFGVFPDFGKICLGLPACRSSIFADHINLLLLDLVRCSDELLRSFDGRHQDLKLLLEPAARGQRLGRLSSGFEGLSDADEAPGVPSDLVSLLYGERATDMSAILICSRGEPARNNRVF